MVQRCPSTPHLLGASGSSECTGAIGTHCERPERINQLIEQMLSQPGIGVSSLRPAREGNHWELAMPLALAHDFIT